MSSHAHQIQALLAHEHDLHRRQVGLVRASLLSVPPRPRMRQSAARARASR